MKHLYSEHYWYLLYQEQDVAVELQDKYLRSKTKRKTPIVHIEVNTIECIANLYHPDKNSYAIDPLQMRDTTQKLSFNTSFYRMSREQTAK